MSNHMSRFLLAALAFLLFLPGWAGAAETVPPLRYTERTLANGLRVYALRDETSPNVAVQVWYGVGGRDDPAGRSGFAHLFEHLMFKATRNMPAETMDRLTEDVGGENNAFAAPDVTAYHETVPANHLERLLWAEAERMGALVVEPESFASERDVVKEELRSRVLAQPYGKLFYLYLPQASYRVHPYGRPGIGSIEDLDAATIEDVRAFHATYYRPDNAVLVVAGNFDPERLDRWVDLYFGPIRRPAGAIPRTEAVEPERTGAAAYTVYEPNTPLPAVLVNYPVPGLADDDIAALEVLDGILSTGESSRFHRSLVYEQGLAAEASSFPDLRVDSGGLVAYAILSEGRSAEEGLAALRAEIARLRDEPVGAAELEEARNELLLSALRERETVSGRAYAVADAVMRRGGAEAADRRLERIAAVTAGDVQRVARRWLRDEAGVAILYLPEEMRPAPEAGDRIETAPTVVARPLETPAEVRIVTLAPEAERTPPPAPGPEIVAPLPRPVVQRLANGLAVISIERRALPLVTASLVVAGGSAGDPPGKAGRAALAAATITEGTATRSATEIDQAVEALGAALQSGADWDGSSIGTTVRTAQLGEALAILADIAADAAFAEEELERQRSQAIDAHLVALRDPGQLARLVAARALYGGSGYGHPSGGTAASLRAIGREDLIAAYRSAWAPANAALILAGDVDAAGALALAERHFGGWAGTAGPAARREARASLRPDLVVVDMPGAGQAAVVVAREALARDDPRFYPVLVANSILGGGYSARLNQEIRIRRGLAYGAWSSVDARRMAGPFVASTQTRNDAAAEVLGLILAEMDRLAAEPLAREELDARRAVLLGNFGRTAETTSGLASLVATYVIRGVGPDEIGRYQQSLLAVSPDEARQAAALLLPAGATMVIVGDASQFIERLRAERPSVTVIPIDALDLDGPSLR